MDRAIELLNKLLKIFNVGDGEYLDLVGDVLRVERNISGDADNQILGLNVLGATAANTDDMKLYWELTKSGSTVTLSFYKDTAKTQKVLEGSRLLDGYFELLEVGGSGLLGNAYVEHTVDDTDAGNIVYIRDLSGEIQINDMNLGAISSPIEYLRRLSMYLVQQLDVTTASGDWLDFIGNYMYGIARIPGEQDNDYSYRIQIIAKLTVPKCTPEGIRNALSKYGDNIQIIEGIDDGAFADVTFSDYYFDQANPGEWVVKAALAGESGGMPFFFRVIMENVDPNDFAAILRILNDFKAAGTTYMVQII